MKKYLLQILIIHRISVWTQSGNNFGNLTTFGSRGAAANQFVSPQRIDISSDGKIYIADQGNHRISVWTQSDNNFGNLTTFGTQGNGFTNFDMPSGIAITADGKILITELNNSRISVWTQSGNNFGNLTTFGTQGTNANQLNRSYGIAISSDGKIYVADYGNNNITVWTQSGSNFGYLTTFGTYGSNVDQLASPLDIHVSSNGNILIVDNNNYRISFWKTLALIFYLQVTFDVTAPTTFTGSTATLTWPTISGAGFGVTYCLRISKDRTMGSGVRTICGLTGNSYKYNPNDPNGRTEAGLEEYYWQVVGVDAEGNYSQWSEVQQFSLDATATSISDASYSVAKVSIYPNPSANGEFRMENGESVTITDVVGKEILSTTKSTFTIVSKGIFIARVKSKSGITTLKLVVE